MKLSLWAVLQAEAKEFKGIKVWHPQLCPVMAIFPYKEAAREYLRSVLENVYTGMANGSRTKNNLNPEESLDFLITEVTVDINEETLHKRGWSVV